MLKIKTAGSGLTELTAQVGAWIATTGITEGLATLFCQHTSASLLITENASSAVPRDVMRWLSRLAPESPAYEHNDEGRDDMPAHLKSLLTGSGLTVPVVGGRLALGTWQGLFLAEHRARAHQRKVIIQVMGK